MSNMLVTDAMVSDALAYLAENVNATAAAKAHRVRAEHHRKRVRASLVLRAQQPSMGLREAWADSHEEYATACEAETRAIEEDEWHRANRNKAEAIIEAWRTMNANVRAAERVR